ncbi:purine and uridine phosphorylase [Aspergillus heteromorphus CBS 117.55]|uniref:Purine and uridine phosphorylase n=1 Tax=Aspergillus heteromorphus CBS 117.55 TaxID=1448321 RepID=A0A317WKW8_9EURO|nr:purine and uridine phosphorylase [Aspergillus heteromorphus CBS 117.55]PWY86705.1 purine and uridine phosphorylase [Aspergillus heteromorphus CBS 117.55]
MPATYNRIYTYLFRQPENQNNRPMSRPALDEFQIGWICALPIEEAAAREILDERFDSLEEQDEADPNIYTLGRIGKHYVVITCLGGEYGMTSATTAANNMTRTFSRSLRVGLLVGVGGGIPSPAHDIRLGDVVISYPTGTCGGVLQHHVGKIVRDGKLIRTGALNGPPRLLLGAVNKMRAAELTDDPLYPSYIDKVIRKNSRTRRNFRRPDSEHDRLFQAQYEHPSDSASCDDCPADWEVARDRRDDRPHTHYGIIASGNLVKNGITRERLRRETGALCFETEAAGLMKHFPCITVRGICDYADSHKNKRWQGYAALVAASYAKELLSHMTHDQVSNERLMKDSRTTFMGEFKSGSKSAGHIEQTIDMNQVFIADGAKFGSSNSEQFLSFQSIRVKILPQIERWLASLVAKRMFWLHGMTDTSKPIISRGMLGIFEERNVLGATFILKTVEENREIAKPLLLTLPNQLVTVGP